MNAIEVSHITKHYDDVRALDDVSFSVKQGGVFGLIGPDSAGRTFLFRIMASLLLTGAGAVSVGGYDVVSQYKEIRQRVGYMLGKLSLCQDLTVEENLQFFADLFGITIAVGYDGIKAIYSRIEPFKNRKAGVLSSGMKQKSALSCVLIHQPSVLFLDELTMGADSASHKELWQMLGMLKERNTTTVAATPYSDEICCRERVAFLDNGRVKAVDGPDEISTQFAEISNPEGLKYEDKPAQMQQGTAEGGQQEKAEDVTQAEHLVKAFGMFHATDDISFSVHCSEIFGLLGANGAGKTIAMHMFTGLDKSTSDKGKVAGLDIRKHSEQTKKHIGYTNQRFSLYEDMTAAQSIKLSGGIYSMSKQAIATKMDDMLRQLYFEVYRNSLVNSLSLGWKQKLVFSVSIFHEPEVAFLDEPTEGVDPTTRRQFWKLVYAASARGITVFVTTHYVDETEYCDRISIMVGGKIRAMGIPDELKYTYRCSDMDEVFTLLVRQATRGE